MNEHASQAAILFPTGGYQWPGMGADMVTMRGREILDRAARALQPHGVEPDSLARLMAGQDQARRECTPRGWTWSGDFPLSMVAQMALGVALAEAWIEHHGRPCVLAGESMGELAAYCLAGVLSLEETADLTYRWACDLQAASEALGLRMAVVEDLELGIVEELAATVDAVVVVTEAPHLCVVALPAANLAALDREVTGRGGHTLVSNNPCAAHDPRLAGQTEVWQGHAEFLAGLAFAPPRIPLLDTLNPGARLDSVDALRTNREQTSFRQVRWDQTLQQLPDLKVRRVIMFGPPSCGYAFKKFRSGTPSCASLRLATIGTLAAI